jgi:hypothetical protein
MILKIFQSESYPFHKLEIPDWVAHKKGIDGGDMVDDIMFTETICSFYVYKTGATEYYYRSGKCLIPTKYERIIEITE